MLKIRLRRMGSRHRPFYRVVVSDSRRAPTASALEVLGFYDPRSNPVALRIDTARADHWLSRGAQPSETVGKLIEQARLAPEAPVVEEAPGRHAAVTESATDEAAKEESAVAEAAKEEGAKKETAAEARKEGAAAEVRNEEIAAEELPKQETLAEVPKKEAAAEATESEEAEKR